MEKEVLRKRNLLPVTFILATASFVFGYTPLLLFYTVIALGGDEHIAFKLYFNLAAVFLFLCYCSLCFNPILYAFRSTNFQEGFKRIIFCRRPRERFSLGVIVMSLKVQFTFYFTSKNFCFAITIISGDWYLQQLSWLYLTSR